MPYKNREKQLEAQKRYYREHQKLAMKLQRDRRDIKRKYIQATKTNVPCADCDIPYPHYMMEFDHVRGIKVSNVGIMYKNYMLEQIKEEIAKCDITCANCHTHRTWMRQSGNKSGAISNGLLKKNASVV